MMPFIFLFPAYLLVIAGQTVGSEQKAEALISVAQGVYGNESNDDANILTNSNVNVDTITWESYKNASRTQVCHCFDQSSQTVYMKGTGFNHNSNREYKIAYYDGKKKLVQTDTFKPNNGVLDQSWCSFPVHKSAQPGTWHAVIFHGAGYNAPQNLDDVNRGQILKDCMFEVCGNAIPELSSIVGAIGLSGFCGLTYIFLRKKRCLYETA